MCHIFVTDWYESIYFCLKIQYLFGFIVVCQDIFCKHVFGYSNCWNEIQNYINVKNIDIDDCNQKIGGYLRFVELRKEKINKLKIEESLIQPKSTLKQSRSVLVCNDLIFLPNFDY